MKFRPVSDGGFTHWCPGCGHPHHLPGGRGWTFSGSGDALTAVPSFAHRWDEPAPGKPQKNLTPRVCHYILAAGILHFQPDSTHALVGRSVPVPDWPSPGA